MPLYEYICKSCLKPPEAIQRMSDSALKDCPACGESALEQQISAPGFRLKGSGWHETDFKTGKKKNLASGNNESSAS